MSGFATNPTSRYRSPSKLYESAAAWSSVEPASLQVAPGGQARAHIRILPPPAGGSSVQGPQRLGVRATPNADATGAVAAEAVVAVTGVVDFSVSIDPPSSKATHYAARDVRITNGGNAPVAVTLSASAGSSELSFEFDHDSVTVAPAQSDQTKLTVKVQRPRRFGRPIDASSRLVRSPTAVRRARPPERSRSRRVCHWRSCCFRFSCWCSDCQRWASR